MKLLDGYTLMHEHMSIDLTPGDLGTDSFELLCRVCDLKSGGGYGYIHLFETFIPMLKARGITEDDIELMLKTNPQTIFRCN